MSDPFQGHWEYRADANGNPVADKVAADGTKLEEGVSVPQEEYDAKRKKAVRDAVDGKAAMQNSLNSAPGQEIMAYLVDLGVVSVEEAEAAGWSGPDVSEPFNG